MNPTGTAVLKFCRRNEIATRIDRQQVIVVPVHIQRVELQATAIVEGHVAADTVEWLPRGDDRRCTVGPCAQQPLHRTPIEVIAAEVQIRVIARSSRSGRLDGVPAFLVTLQIEAVLKIGVDVLEVRIGGNAYSSRVPTGCGWNVRIIRALRRPARVLVNKCDRVVVAPGMPSAA